MTEAENEILGEDIDNVVIIKREYMWRLEYNRTLTNDERVECQRIS